MDTSAPEGHAGNMDISPEQLASPEEILRRRAEELAVEAEDAQQSGEEIHFVEFEVSKRNFGVELRHVSHVVSNTKISPLPGSHEHLVGIVEARGRIVSVLWISRLLDLRPSVEGSAGKIIVLRNRDKWLGIWVDRIIGVRQVPVDELQPFTGEHSLNMEKGFIGLSNDGAIVLDIVNLLDNYFEGGG